MGTAQSLSSASKVAFVAALVVPLVAVLAWANSAAETVTVDANIAVLADGLTVQSTFETDGCGEPLRLDITESPQEVRVRTLVRQDSGFPGGCTDIAVRQRLHATLEEPLGGRTLVAVPGDPRNDG